ncbi:hypothetical protein JMJ55_29960 [Belnapia sp. T6]|uniref:Plasmid encoded RepA protein n=1 Tax=Belnapia mucosa TaxID=2804532 RepID=A0ABS1VD67_9PROT|nr:replication protein RepA [Belnapia mucosa]MBL6459537.1 hypothetical protein [Belnapia mucosa]
MGDSAEANAPLSLGVEQALDGSLRNEIIRLGYREALNHAACSADRRCIQVSQMLLADEEAIPNFTHSVFAMTALPHKRTDEPEVVRDGPNMRLRIESGKAPDGLPVGVPYGHVARLILFYLQTEAVRTRSREIDLGRSLHRWLKKMGLNCGGKGYEAVREQRRRLSVCRLTFYRDSEKNSKFLSSEEISSHSYGASKQNRVALKAKIDETALKSDNSEQGDEFWRNDSSGDIRGSGTTENAFSCSQKKKQLVIVLNSSFVREAILPLDENAEIQPDCWQDKILLDEMFYNSLINHSLPVRETAIRALSGNTIATDLYVWLAYRLHYLKKPTRVRWFALYRQFGAGFALPRQFKSHARNALALALAAYPEAKVQVDNEGVTLFPSPAPVPDRS